MERNKETLPADYEPCGTCGCDHSYDLSLLNEEELAQVKWLHEKDEA